MRSTATHHAIPAFLVILFLVSPTISTAGNDSGSRESLVSRTWDSVKLDYSHFYSSDSLICLGLAYGVGGLMANTSTDENMRNWYQERLRSSRTDSLSATFKQFGNGDYVIPVSVAAAGIGLMIPGESEASVIGIWGQRAARAYLVGGPATLLMQRVTGGSRPGERDDASHWRPFTEENGVSGHAFVGAVPFLTLARMSDNPLVCYLSYAASTLAGLSRINDDAHFTSQVFLGWYMAFEATGAVAERDEHDAGLRFFLLPWGDGAAVQLSWRW
jgi:hypothetical protein